MFALRPPPMSVCLSLALMLCAAIASAANGDQAVVIVEPGTGNGAPTTQPARIGIGPGSDAKAIARWDVVPFQTFSDDFTVGVVAFHINDIDRVEFSVNGGRWAAVRTPSLDPATGVVEYWSQVRASGLGDGPFELRAVAYPRTGVPRVLDPLPLFSNVHGSLPRSVDYVSPNGNDTNAGTKNSPYLTIARGLAQVGDGGLVVLLDAGNYQFGALTQRRLNSRWITVAAADGLTPEKVVVRQEQRDVLRTGTERLCFKGISFDFHSIIQIYPDVGGSVWFDRCRWFDSVGWADSYNPQMQPVRSRSAIAGSYVTDCIAEDMVYGFTDQSLVRHCAMRKISSDALQNSSLVLNCKVDTMDAVLPETHNDVLQYFGRHENVIVFGVKGTGIRQTQGIFLDHSDSSFQDCAFVDIQIETPQSDPPFSQLCSSENHVLFREIKTRQQSWLFREDLPRGGRFQGHNVAFSDCVFRRLLTAVPRGVSMHGCRVGMAGRSLPEIP